MESAGWKLPRGVLFGKNKEEKGGLDRNKEVFEQKSCQKA